MAFFNFLLNLIYPKHCVSCKKLGDYLCEDCFEAVEYLVFPPKIKIKKVYFDSIHSLTYLSPPISQLIRTMKYKHVKGIAKYLGKWLYLMLPIRKIDLENIDFITAVPMHLKRKSWRGFNQAEIMGKTLANLYEKKYLPLLTKKSQTKSQVSVGSNQARKLNLKNIFELEEKYLELVKNTNIMLVDDILTTGATFNECSKVLKDNEVEKVLAVSFGRRE